MAEVCDVRVHLLHSGMPTFALAGQGFITIGFSFSQTDERYWWILATAKRLLI